MTSHINSMFMTARNHALFVVVTTITLFNCASQEHSTKIDYLGQKPPGLVAELFAPGVISTDAYEHSAPAFSPDGSVVLWTVLDANYHASMMEMKSEKGEWSPPYRPSFADSTADDYYPSFSPDGKKLYFSSRRKLPPGYPEGTDIRIWEVARKENGWEKPIPFDTTVAQGQEYAHSVTRSGTMYFSSPRNSRTSFNIYKAEKANNGYSKAILFPFNINSLGYEDGPYIEPDEKFLIFESDRPEGIEGSLDLYISFKNPEGEWGLPINMGPKINSASGERFARLSPDGKYLFFGSTRRGRFDIFWIDVAILYELQNGIPQGNVIENRLGENIFTSINEEKDEIVSPLLQQWLKLHPDNLDAILIYSSTLRKLKRYAEAEQLLERKISRWNENVNFVLELALLKLGLNKNDEALKLLSPVLVEGDQQGNRFKYLSTGLLEMKKFEESDAYFEKAMVIHSNMYEYYRRARAYAHIGAKDQAFENLNKAIEQGFISKQEIENDVDFRILKSDIRFEALQRKLK